MSDFLIKNRFKLVLRSYIKQKDFMIVFTVYRSLYTYYLILKKLPLKLLLKFRY